MLGIIPDAEASRLKTRLRDYDSMVVIIGHNGEGTFGWKRNHRGELWFTERTAELKKDQQFLETLRRQATPYTAAHLHRMKKHLTRW